MSNTGDIIGAGIALGVGLAVLDKFKKSYPKKMRLRKLRLRRLR